MDSLVGTLVPGGVPPGHSGPCAKPAWVGVPGRVLLPLACKGGCPLCLLGSRDTCGIGGGSGCPLRPAGHPSQWETRAVRWSPPGTQQHGCVHGSQEVDEGKRSF